MGFQSQFQPRLVASNGTIYWARTKSFEQIPSFYCDRLMGYTMPRIRAIDLDTPEDLEFARVVAKTHFG
jgi:CMP-N-acetylneuraminic acid synthetase